MAKQKLNIALLLSKAEDLSSEIDKALAKIKSREFAAKKLIHCDLTEYGITKKKVKTLSTKLYCLSTTAKLSF